MNIKWKNNEDEKLLVYYCMTCGNTKTYNKDTVVNPKLYFSLGISGAIQHQVGMKGSNHIMAINKDPNAPIFEISDYAVIGDLLEIIPKLIEKIKES